MEARAGESERPAGDQQGAGAGLGLRPGTGGRATVHEGPDSGIGRTIRSIYDWHDDNGKLVFHTVRCVDLSGKKKILPVTPCTRLTAGDRDWKVGDFAWRVIGPDGVRPAYNIPEDKGQRTVLVLEGEKTANVGREFFRGQDVWVTTSHGGSKSAWLTDWTRLRGRKVVIGHDLDASGLAYAAVIAAIADEVQAASVHLWTVPTSHVVRRGQLTKRSEPLKRGYDLADSREDGWTYSLLVTRQQPWHGPAVLPAGP